MTGTSAIKELKNFQRLQQIFRVITKKINPLSANPIKWSNTLKQFVSNLGANCLSVFDHFVKLALKGLSAFKR